MDSFRVFIGGDARFREPAKVVAHSIRRRSSVPVQISYLDRRHLMEYHDYKPTPDPRASTEFSSSRFLVPWLCGYAGVALFTDCDVVCLGDVAELARLALAMPSDGLALRCVQHHEYCRAAGTKMAGVEQVPYARKAWSSLMLMDCSRLTRWTKELVETCVPALRLHQFADVPDERIGAIDPLWNCLDVVPPGCKILHMTNGGPFNDRTKVWPNQEVWLAERRDYRLANGLDPDAPVESQIT